MDFFYEIIEFHQSNYNIPNGNLILMGYPTALLDQSEPCKFTSRSSFFKTRTCMLASVAFDKMLSLPLPDTEDVRWRPNRLHIFDEMSASDTSGLARGAIAKLPLLPLLLAMAVVTMPPCVDGLFAVKSASDPPPLPIPCCCCCSAYSRAARSRGHLP